MRAIGGDVISSHKALGTTFFLINGWRIRPFAWDHVLRVNGNLYTDPAGFDPFAIPFGSYSVTVELTVSSLVEASLAQLPEIEQASFDGKVTIDVINGTFGTDYPIGTSRTPVNNLTDAKIIAAISFNNDRQNNNWRIYPPGSPNNTEVPWIKITR